MGGCNKDHVPPKQLFFKVLRQNAPLQPLNTLKTHKECNSKYQKDEEYFVTSLFPFITDDLMKRGVLDHLRNISKREMGQTFLRMIQGEFTHKYGNIYIPDNKLGIRIDYDRVNNVVWKIARGIYFLENGEFLPGNVEHVIQGVYQKIDDIPDEVKKIYQYLNTSFKGQNPRIFTYNMLSQECINFLHFVFWNSLGFIIAFKYPE